MINLDSLIKRLDCALVCAVRAGDVGDSFQRSKLTSTPVAPPNLIHNVLIAPRWLAAAWVMLVGTWVKAGHMKNQIFSHLRVSVFLSRDIMIDS